MTLLSRAECSALRGIAIIGIFLHNYLHWLGPMVKENEYQFHMHNAERFWYILSHPDQNLLYHLFSFFGHYGVPVFVFLSGYGLYLKYESGVTEQQINGTTGLRINGIWEFMKSHYLKLFPMMFLGFCVFAMVDWMTPGHHHWTWDAIIEQLTMTINIFPDPDHRIWPGPYWFFGLMMELYLVYRLFLYRRHWGWNVGKETPSRPPRGGGEFFTLHSSLFTFLLSTAAIILLSFNFWTWLIVPFFVVVAHVALIKMLSAIPAAGILVRGMAWVGGISAAIFVCHPITRKIFIPISRSGDILDGLTIYIIATILLAMIFKKMLDVRGQR